MPGGRSKRSAGTGDDALLARNLAERRLSTDRVITPLPGDEEVRITATVANTELLFRWLRSLGPRRGDREAGVAAAAHAGRSGRAGWALSTIGTAGHPPRNRPSAPGPTVQWRKLRQSDDALDLGKICGPVSQ